jgi:MFS family permease
MLCNCALVAAPRRGFCFSCVCACVVCACLCCGALVSLTSLHGHASNPVQAVGLSVQMFASIGSSQNVVALTFFSVAQSASRVASGRLCDVLKNRALPRTIIINAALALMVLAYGLFIWNTAASLFAGVVAAATAFGAVWPAMVVLVSELFGEAHLGGNYMLFDGCCSAVGALLFGKFIAEAVYDAHIPAGQSNCVGPECFRLTYVLISCLLLSALAASLLLSRRTWTSTGRSEPGKPPVVPVVRLPKPTHRVPVEQP